MRVATSALSKSAAQRRRHIKVRDHSVHVDYRSFPRQNKTVTTDLLHENTNWVGLILTTGLEWNRAIESTFFFLQVSQPWSAPDAKISRSLLFFSHFSASMAVFTGVSPRATPLEEGRVFLPLVIAFYIKTSVQCVRLASFHDDACSVEASRSSHNFLPVCLYLDSRTSSVLKVAHLQT